MRSNNLTEINFETFYTTGSNHEPHEMMSRGFGQSILYRRASGYFSSSVLDLFKSETLDFVQAGGTINIMCSPVMSSQDLQQISLGYEAKELFANRLLKDVSDLASFSESGHEISFLATLIQKSVLNIKLVFFENGGGIFHDKSGYFKDRKNNYLSFSGSANESSNAFSGGGNFERISVFPSWNSNDYLRCQSTCQYVDDLWSGDVNGLGVFDFPDVAKEFLVQFARNDMDEFKSILAPKTKTNKKVKTLMRHQELALENWKAAGKRGILKHATGSGKTVTAISAIRDQMKAGKPTLVLVPSKLLLLQWYVEIKNELGDVLIMRCGAGHYKWRKSSNLRQMCQNSSNDQPGSIILAINDTATSVSFLDSLTNLENILIVADEVHSLGSEKNKRIFDKKFAFRLGLSATPERYRDAEGTKVLFDFFGGIVEPEVTLKDALLNGRLVPYDYYPVSSHLSAEEEDKWIVLTKKIVNYLRSRDLDFSDARSDKVVSSMLINRSRIAKKAQSKIKTVVDILSKHYKKGQHWLVYCEDGDQLQEINDELAFRNINPFIYVSNMSGSSAGELEAFSSESGILLSIRCLDEGVDIPKVSHAIIAASSQNPRQFIQRRGRVLRQYPNKNNAVLYDCIVGPADATNDMKFDGLIFSEAVRSLEFARTARNKISAISVLRNILIGIGADPVDIMNQIEGDIEYD